jgi:hypothetical protein
MVSFSSWAHRTVKVSIEVEGFNVNLSVRPNLMTPEREIQLSETTGRDSIDELLKFFCEYVTAWDITDDDGKPLVLDPKVVSAALPSSVIRAILVESREAVDNLGN